MTVFDIFKSKNIDELAEWLDEHIMPDAAPWIKWFDSLFCKQCEEESFYDEESGVETICVWCEYHGKCKFFEHLDNIPDGKQVAKMWLESEV